MTSALFFQLQSIIIYGLMILGISKRKNRRHHVPLMAAVIIWDVILIIQIELTRGAIEKASKIPVNPFLLNIHVTFAVLSVVFYGLLVWTGKKLLNADNSVRKRHRVFGWSAFTLRTLTLLTSFFVAAPKI